MPRLAGVVAEGHQTGEIVARGGDQAGDGQGQGGAQRSGAGEVGELGGEANPQVAMAWMPVRIAMKITRGDGVLHAQRRPKAPKKK